MSFGSDPHALRRLVGSVCGRLLARVGRSQVGEVEDCVQDALVRAFSSWPYQGVPDDPGAWLTRVAWHRWIDRHRRHALEQRAMTELVEASAVPSAGRHDTLLALFVGASSTVPPTARVSLSLRLACGLGSKEIARLLELTLAAVEKRLTRGRTALAQAARKDVDVTAASLGSVLETLAALFTAGVEAFPEDATTGPARAAEALHLMDDVVGHPELGEEPVAWACAAWMRLTAARLPARTEKLRRVSFRDQDRSRWSGALLRSGLEALQQASRASRLSVWHLMAGIAALHAEAPTWESTNWRRVRSLYEDLFRVRGSYGDFLGLAVAIWRTDGAKAAERWLDTRRRDSAPHHALVAELCEEAGLDASGHWTAAMSRSRSPEDRAYYCCRLEALATAKG